MISDFKEFRLGNLVMDKVSGEWMEIFEIGANITANVLNREKYPLPDGWQMAPIPLSEDILEKCGFKPYNDDGLWLCIGWESFTLQNRYLSYDGFDAKLWNEDIMPIVTSLHRLQNLYFALTGEELAYKL